MGHMKSITETQDYFEELMESIALPAEDRQQIFIDLNNHFEQWIDKVFATIRGKKEQYCLTLDLYSILKRTSWAREYCSHVLEDFIQVFQFSEAERLFFDDFYHAAKQDDCGRAKDAYQRFMEEGYNIPYELLTWFYPGFYLEEHYDGIKVPAGKTFFIDHPTSVTGNIEVEKGGSLLINGSKLTMKGNIIVRGGRLQMEGSDIRVADSSLPCWLKLEDTAFVTVQDTKVDCQYCCGVLEQNSGRLLVEDSIFAKTDRTRALIFSGKDVIIRHTSFYHCRNGMIGLERMANARIELCDFQDAHAEYGGAVYSNTLHDVWIKRCTFQDCHAKYLGAAVYFNNQKLGQRVEDCKCSSCTPSEDVFFNIL